MRFRFNILNWRDALVILIPVALVVGAGFWAAAQFIKPAPPRQIIMTTGGPGGAYAMFATRYKQLLERYGVELVEMPSQGAVDNLQRLLDPQVAVDVGLVQGGLGVGTDTDGLVSLGAVYYEPLWVFYRGRDVDDLGELRGKRIAVGGEGSGTRKLALDLLHAHELTGPPTQLDPLGGFAAVQALADGKVDAAMLVGPVNSGAVWTALFTPDVKLMSMSRADAYVRRHPYLHKLDAAARHRRSLAQHPARGDGAGRADRGTGRARGFPPGADRPPAAGRHRGARSAGRLQQRRRVSQRAPGGLSRCRARRSGSTRRARASCSATCRSGRRRSSIG